MKNRTSEFDLQYALGRVRQELIRREDGANNADLLKKAAAIRKKLFRYHAARTKALVKKLRETISLWMVCGPHWREITEDSSAFFAKHVKFHHSLKVTEMDLDAMVVLNDYPVVDLQVSFPEKYCSPRVELNALAAVLCGKLDVSFAPKPRISFHGLYDNQFYHVHIDLTNHAETK